MDLRNSFETALADETTVTAGNSDDGTAGDAFNFIVNDGDSVIVYDSLRPAHGSLGMRIQAGSGNFCAVRWDITETEIWGRQYIYREDHPSAGNPQWIGRFESSTAIAGLVYWGDDGLLYVFDSTITGTPSIEQVPLDDHVRIETHLIAHASAGEITAEMYLGDSMELIDDPVSRTGVNTLAALALGYFGNCNSNASGSSWHDDLGISDVGSIGPAVPPVEKQAYYATRRRSWR